MVSSPDPGEQDQGGQHGRLFSGSRTKDEAALRLVEGERSTALCRRGGNEAGARWYRVHCACSTVRSQDHPPGVGGTGSRRRLGHQSGPKKGGGRKKLMEIDTALEQNFFEVLR